MLWVITALGGATRGVSWELEPGEWLVGRSHECDIRIVDPQVSRRQCVLVSKRERLLLRVLAASIPVYVNENIVTECFLCPGDELSIGTAVFMVSQIEPTMIPKFDTAALERTTQGLASDARDSAIE